MAIAHKENTNMTADRPCGSRPSLNGAGEILKHERE
jgi:hypothetical protein